MTLQELEGLVVSAMRQPGNLGVVLTIPKGKMPRGFPRGELLNEMQRSGVVERTYRFPPDKIMKWLVKNN